MIGVTNSMWLVHVYLYVYKNTSLYVKGAPPPHTRCSFAHKFDNGSLECSSLPLSKCVNIFVFSGGELCYFIVKMYAKNVAALSQNEFCTPS